eukprot:scaffold7346_cov245-Pinguiococcus_pyrenoidosus.AAC.5
MPAEVISGPCRSSGAGGGGEEYAPESRRRLSDMELRSTSSTSGTKTGIGAVRRSSDCSRWKRACAGLPAELRSRPRAVDGRGPICAVPL